MLCYPIFCLLWVLPLKTNQCTFLHTHTHTQKKKKKHQKVERKALKPKPSFRSHSRDLSESKFVSTYHHCGIIGHLKPQCSMLKREQNHVVRSLPKKPSEHKPIVCHYCGAFGHQRPHCSKFQALKWIKRKEKLELLGSYALQAKLD